VSVGSSGACTSSSFAVVQDEGETPVGAYAARRGRKRERGVERLVVWWEAL
jgi:hypothetical protein